ncbi:unnamed protein product [Vitrella brassicaformis CCMP3155]|uniref:Uncharacterized protein n=1 Tax=Vitrella brassicaformis (strain CCMP3155) TaxID=1169540 RepID=A0A0G4EC07_VITBC|nr:unnamed protein product [Vitrella brassicaformis CCMP3155]|eukprot:CEL93211.1 unnamed protein product [Vitrella brassicaformis CCMP3155]
MSTGAYQQQQGYQQQGRTVSSSPPSAMPSEFYPLLPPGMIMPGTSQPQSLNASEMNQLIEQEGGPLQQQGIGGGSGGYQLQQQPQQSQQMMAQAGVAQEIKPMVQQDSMAPTMPQQHEQKEPYQQAYEPPSPTPPPPQQPQLPSMGPPSPAASFFNVDQPPPPQAPHQQQQPPSLPTSVLSAFEPSGRGLLTPDTRLMLKTVVPAGLGNIVRDDEKAVAARRLEADAKAIESLEGIKGREGQPVTPPVVAWGSIEEGSRPTIRLMDAKWHRYRDLGFDGSWRPPLTHNTRRTGELQGFYVLNKYAAFLPAATRIALEEEHPPPDQPDEADEDEDEDDNESDDSDDPVCNMMRELRERTMSRAACEAPASAAAEEEAEVSGDEGEDRRVTVGNVRAHELWTGAVTLADLANIKAGLAASALLFSAAERRSPELIRQTLGRLRHRFQLAANVYRRLIVSVLSALQAIHGAGGPRAAPHGSRPSCCWLEQYGPGGAGSGWAGCNCRVIPFSLQSQREKARGGGG